MSYFSRNASAVNPFTEARDDRVQKSHPMDKRASTIKAEEMTKAAEAASAKVADPALKHKVKEASAKARDAELGAMKAHSDAMLDSSKEGDARQAQIHSSAMRQHMATAQQYNGMAASAGDGYGGGW